MKIRKILEKGVMSCVNMLAVLLVAQTANSACIWLIYQPEFPKEGEKFKRKVK